MSTMEWRKSHLPFLTSQKPHKEMLSGHPLARHQQQRGAPHNCLDLECSNISHDMYHRPAHLRTQHCARHLMDDAHCVWQGNTLYGAVR